MKRKRRLLSLVCWTWVRGGLSTIQSGIFVEINANQG